jgi:hypothetical protein
MDLAQEIRDAVASGRFLVSRHAARRLMERGIELWQLEASLDLAEIEEIRPHDEPNPSLVAVQELPDGTEVNVVWAWLTQTQEALLVTVHFFGDGI